MATIDHAFQSRINLHLPYRDLTPDAHRRVWETFIDHTGPERFELSDGDLDELSNVKTNDREIKSMIKSANLLSLKGGRKIDMSRISMLVENREVAGAAFGAYGARGISDNPARVSNAKFPHVALLPDAGSLVLD